MKIHEDNIAVIGLGCIFPDAPDPDQYWDNILNKRCSISDHPEPEAQRTLDPESHEFDRVYTIRGGYLGNLATFDPLEFGIMPDTVKGADPNHFLALKTAKAAFVDAGLDPSRFPSERTDLIVGHGGYVNTGNTTWSQHGLVMDQTCTLLRTLVPDIAEEEVLRVRSQLKATLPPLNPQTFPTLIMNILSGRIANRLDCMGANYVVDAACASSLIAVDHGVDNLLLDKCDIAIVGGVLVCLAIQGLMVFNQIGALSRQDTLRPFDESADGTMLSEGVGMLILRRQRDAERDGNRIYALIKGVGIASDGRSSGLLAPQVKGEAMAISRAYERAGVSPDTVELIEAHGTGIPLGDATEMKALRNVFGGRVGRYPRCAVGSVKSMIGHCTPAAGVAGLIKAILSLHHKVLPPTLHVEKPHPDLELDRTPFYLNTEPRPWVHGRSRTPRRAGVSAMGFGGINAHCVLEEYG